MVEEDGASSVEEATVEKVKRWVFTASTTAQKDLSERLEGVIKSITY